MLHVVLVRPQIPTNTGSIGRTCLNFDAKLHLVGPLGFSLDSSKVKRAGLDYWQHVDLSVYDDWEHFEEKNRELLVHRFYLSKFGSTSLLDARFPSSSSGTTPRSTTLVFGSETSGLYETIGEKAMQGYPVISLPMLTAFRSKDTPSFNLASCVSMVMWEAWKQHAQANPFLLQTSSKNHPNQ
uniref:tRNA/rRNA methyltransferase SpoU type domain-containing protein n=1 Tax=Arcella intermedia TaxID=1963864 RepID=A0A6B2LL55_9EUKA